MFKNVRPVRPLQGDVRDALFVSRERNAIKLLRFTLHEIRFTHCARTPLAAFFNIPTKDMALSVPGAIGRIKTGMKKTVLAVLGCLVFTNFLGMAFADGCDPWGNARVIGHLDPRRLPEASGLAISKQFKNRLYHINDSENSPSFFLTDQKGGHLKTIHIRGSLPLAQRKLLDHDLSDFEALSLGPCLEQTSCLFIGDIGDNRGFGDTPNREAIQIIVIREEEHIPSPVRPLYRVTLSYPDGPHNAEGMAVHPNGDIFILTKEMSLLRWKAFPAGLYKITRKEWEENSDSVHVLTKVGQLDIPHWTPSSTSLFGQVVTGFDISPDGKRFLILTYDFAFEVWRDLSEADLWMTEKLKIGKDFHMITLLPLPQPEGIAYVPDGKSFLYHTEFSRRWFQIIRGQGVKKVLPALVQVDCLSLSSAGKVGRGVGP